MTTTTSLTYSLTTSDDDYFRNDDYLLDEDYYHCGDYYHDDYYHDGDDHQEVWVNKTPVIGCAVTFLTLACMLNAVVVVLVLRLYIQQPAVRVGSPKLFLMLLCAVMQIVEAVVPTALSVLKYSETMNESSFTCETTVTETLGFYVLECIVSLLVGALAVVEGFRLQSFISLSAGRLMAVAVISAVLCVLYGFVVTIPLFYVSFLRDTTSPCREGTIFLDIDYEHFRDLYVGSFIVPQCLVGTATVFLLVAYFARRCGSYADVHSQCHAPLLSRAVSEPSGDPGHRADVTTADSLPGSEPCVQPFSDPSDLEQRTAVTAPGEDGRFPWHVLVAGAVSFMVRFVVFVAQYDAISLPVGDFISLLTASSLLHVLKGVLLPCCWLLDREVRSLGCWAPKGLGLGGSGSPTLEEGQEMADTTRV